MHTDLHTQSVLFNGSSVSGVTSAGSPPKEPTFE